MRTEEPKFKAKRQERILGEEQPDRHPLNQLGRLGSTAAGFGQVEPRLQMQFGRTKEPRKCVYRGHKCRFVSIS